MDCFETSEQTLWRIWEGKLELGAFRSMTKELRFWVGENLAEEQKEK